MKQIEATEARPFFSVAYLYERNPHTVWEFTHYFEFTGDETQTTMQGTDDEKLAKDCADWLIKQNGIKTAWVHKSVDCYNHKEIYQVSAIKVQNNIISSKIINLLLKSNKILKTYYQSTLNGRNLTKQEIIDEAKNLIRKSEKGNLDDGQERVFCQLEKSDWQAIAELSN